MIPPQFWSVALSGECRQTTKSLVCSTQVGSANRELTRCEVISGARHEEGEANNANKAIKPNIEGKVDENGELTSDAHHK